MRTAIVVAGSRRRRRGTGEPGRRQEKEVVACADADANANAELIGLGQAPAFKVVCILCYAVLCCVAPLPFAKSPVGPFVRKKKDDRSSSITEYGEFLVLVAMFVS